MKLIYVYGPPASGKLTIANELSKITGFKIFDNHKVIDLFSEIADINKNSFWDSANEIKLKIIEECAKQRIKGIIFTMVYTKNPKNHLFPEKINSIVKKNKGKVYFVRLKCNRAGIRKRVIKESRKKFKKFHTIKELENFTRKYDVHGKLNFENQIEIDNTNKSAKEVAKEIKEFVGRGEKSEA
jgi:broad-specificity NMP kinase